MGSSRRLRGSSANEISNVLLRRGDAQAVIKAVPDAFFSRIFMLYPDPWPKRRHHKRRVVSVGFIAALARVMRNRRRVSLRHGHRRLCRLDPFSLSRFSPFPLDCRPSRRLAPTLAWMASNAL